MTIYTIGFTKKTAEQFFERLKKSGASRLVDVRLNNVSQLAGFSKRDDLNYFLRSICSMDYVHLPAVLAPTKEILDDYKKKNKRSKKSKKNKKSKGAWGVYEQKFLALMASRRIESEVPREVLDGGCLLCSEDKPDDCHRRLIAEYLAEKWGDVQIVHL